MAKRGTDALVTNITSRPFSPRKRSSNLFENIILEQIDDSNKNITDKVSQTFVFPFFSQNSNI